MRIDENGNWRSFRHRNFRILFAANSLSNIGSWAQRIAQDWLVLQLTHSGTYLGLVTALQFVPVLMFSLHGGALADRFDKRKVLVLTNLGAGASSATLGLLVVTNTIQLWHVFFLAFFLGSANAVDNPVRQAFNAEVVGHADVGNAVSLNSANFNAGRMVGPAISGALIAAFGTGPSFLINAFSYMVVIASLLKLQRSQLFAIPKSDGVASIREGLRYAKARPDLHVVMIVIFFMATFGLNFQIFNALMATKVFHRGAVSFGLLGTFLAIGSFSGSLLSARLDRFRKPSFVIFGATCFGLAITALSFAPTYLAYAIWLPICGFFALTTLIMANTLMQMNSDPVLRGRIMGIYLLVFLGGAPFGSPLIGFMAERIGVRFTVASCGVVTASAAMATWLRYRDKIMVPSDVSIEIILPPTYDNKS